MLTPQEITDKVFVKAVFGGYDMTEVDDFLESLSVDYAALYKENAILKGKLKVLVEKVEEYRSTEDAMRMALLTAQKMGEEITVEANKQKEAILKDVSSEAKMKLAEVKKLVSDEHAKLAIASKETAKFIKLSQAIMQKHSTFLTKLETARRAVATEAAQPAPAPAPAPLPVQEPQIVETVESSVEDMLDHESIEPIYDNDHDQHVEYDENGEPIDHEEESTTTTPRPRFDFDDLKFGANFDIDG
ncbi:MAG: DivIVA domain-containing protein [Oscillospiraceae bacterium]|nr:DivIVA domain-containing protein [Oscillospiraceae bacterium]